MKKLLSVLAAVGLSATASTAVVACGSSKKADTVDIKDGAIEMKVNNTKDLTWGEEGKVEIKDKDGKVTKTVSTITQLLMNSKDEKIKAIANHIKDELGIKDFKDKNGNPILGTSYFGTTAPKNFKDGQEIDNQAMLNDLPNATNDANKASFDEDAKAGKTLYIVLRDVTKGKDGFKEKCAVLKLSFNKIETKTAA